MKRNIKLLWFMSMVAIASASEDKAIMNRRRLNKTTSPSPTVSAKPSDIPSISPSRPPSAVPSHSPSFFPTVSIEPTLAPSGIPTGVPSSSPTGAPSNVPSESMSPTSVPTRTPSKQPSALPTRYPSNAPTESISPTSEPTRVPSSSPTKSPSATPSGAPTESSSPSTTPSSIPSPSPSSIPSESPSNIPSTSPTIDITESPSLPITMTPTETNCELLEDSTEPFEIPNGPIVTCEDVQENWRNARCKKEVTQENCPFTCTDECFFAQPTAAPTNHPTVTPPLPVDATVQFRVGPVDGNIMDSDSASYFTRTLGDALQDIFDEIEYPKIELTDLEVTKQTLVENEDSGYSVLVNLKVSAMVVFVELIRKLTESSEFATGLLEIFNDEDFLNDLIDDLQSRTVDGADYFEDISEISVNYLQNANSLEADDSNPGLSQKNIIIIVASAVAGAAAIVAVAFFVWQRSKRSQIIDKHDDLDLDDEENFGIAPEKDEWDQMQPERPFSDSRSKARSILNPFHDSSDDATEGGKSQRTFNTLEKIYSNCSDDGQGSFGYSLDSAVVSKPMPSVTSGKSDEKSGPLTMDLYGLASKKFNFDHDMEVSLCSPTSAYSGLTYDSSSLKGTQVKTPMNGDITNDAPETVIRECIAPPGKLGVVIDTTRDGPIVHLVKDGSPLENQIFPGDRIIAIDSVDTTSMSASNVTKIMASKMNATRKITVSSKILSGTY